MITSEYLVTGMTCGHCEMSIREEVGAISGIQHVDVSAATGELHVAHDGTVNDEVVLGAIVEAGYEAVRVK